MTESLDKIKKDVRRKVVEALPNVIDSLIETASDINERGSVRAARTLLDFANNIGYCEGGKTLSDLAAKLRAGKTEEAHNELISAVINNEISHDEAVKLSSIIKVGEDIRQGGEVSKLIDELEKKLGA